MLPPTKKRERKSARLQEALVPTTEPKSGATTISTNKEAHTELDNAVAPGQMPVPLPSSVLTPTEHQQPKVSKLKLKSKGKVHLTSCKWNDSPFHSFVLRKGPTHTSASNGPRLTQRVQELHKEGETNPIRSTEGQKLKERNPETLRAATGKRMILNPSVSPELQPGRLLSPPSIIKSYRSEITVQSPGEGSSSPPSPAHGDNYGENDATGLLLELSAKNIATSLVPLSPAPIPTRPFAEIDETGSEGAKVESEISEGDERQVVPSVGSQARRKSSESYWSKSSSDPSSTKGKPSPNSRSTTLPTPPIVQSASSIRPQPKNAFPQLSSPPAAVDLSPKVLESPVIEKHKSLIQYDISIEQGDVNQPRDEELKPTRILHHVCCFLKHVSHADLLKVADTSTPSPLLRKLRPSQSLPRLSVISRKFPRTVVPLLLPKSTSLYTPTMPNPNLDDSEDVMSSDDDSSDTDDQNSTQIPANQQAASRPVRRQQRNVLATF